jgi:hypothetical protein
LEEVTSALLMARMNLWEVHHLLGKFSLLETLVNQEIVLLMHGTLTTQPLLEEVSRFGKELAKVATVPCIKSTISWLTRVSSKENLPRRWCTSQRFILAIKSAEVTSSKNGITDKELFRTECGLHT